MSPKNFSLLILLAALWGASFLFIRVGVADFGPVPLMAIRVIIAALFLVPILLLKRGFHRMSGKLGALFVVGVLNQAAPFCLFAYAELSLSAGVTSVINATTPLWAALVAFAWFGDRLTVTRSIGLVLGFTGVLIVVWKDLAGLAVLNQTALAPLAVLAATLFYGVSANLTKKLLTGVDSLAVATGSMLGAAIALAPIAVVTWPSTSISGLAWLSVIVLGIACTGLAYMIYFHLIGTVGPTRAVSVTFLIPLFGILWGSLFLHEVVTLEMAVGFAIVITGTALASGLVKFGRTKSAA